MRVLLDTNIILDLLLNRIPWRTEAEAIDQAARQGRLKVYATAVSVADVFYIARRHSGRDKAWSSVRACLDAFDILAVDGSILTAASRSSGPDFEDNIQIAAAAAAGLDGIVTRDPSGFADSPVAVLTPQDLLVRLS